MSMYATLNGTTSFRNLWTTWGTGNFTFSFNGVAATGLSNVTYGEVWVTWSSGIRYFNEEFWIGVLTYHASPGPPPCTPPSVTYALSGPYTLYYPANFHATLTVDWAGLELYTPSLHTLLDAQGITVVPAFSTPSTTPSNVPSGDTVDPVEASWYGLTDQAKGAGASNIVQTGWQIDTKNPSSSYGGGSAYSIWYENWPGPSVNYPFGHAPSPGDTEVMGVGYAGWWYWWWSEYISFVIDQSAGTFSFSYMWTSSSWTPHYAEGIIEVPEPCGGCPGGKPMQIPEFESETFVWPWGLATVASGTYSAGTLYSGGNFNDYYVQQDWGIRSTYETLSVSANSDTVTWSASDYDYNYV